jgi:general secretion pathway protein G
MATRTTNRSGFTLVEILIVVVILGILAAIVVPHFANASVDARRSSLTSTLQSLRAQIQFYMLQHGDKPPPLTGADWTVMTEITTYNGKDTGPYLATIPTNPVNGKTEILPVTSDQVGGASVDTPDMGFVYNTTNGKIWATNTAMDKIFNEVNPGDPDN